MLAPASLRPGSSGGDADRRRQSRLVVIAVVAAILAILLPVALALSADDENGVAPGPVATPQTSPPSTSRAAPTSSVPTAAPTTSPAADPGLLNAAASSPVAADPAPDTTTDSPTPPAGPTATPESTPAASDPLVRPAANWMEALRPQVDPEGLATWVFEPRGAWGASDGHTVFIDPDVPEDKRWSVMVHEYGHVLQVRHYGSLNATAAALNARVRADPTDKGPTESNADCIAELLGATWTDYGCQDALRPVAAALVAEDPAAAALAARA